MTNMNIIEIANDLVTKGNESYKGGDINSALYHINKALAFEPRNVHI